MPTVSRPTPNLTGFAEAQDTKRGALGSDVIFLMAPVKTWPAGTAINPDTGEPYDVTLSPVSVDQDQVTIRCGVFFKAVNRGGAANAALGSEVGWQERTRIFAVAPYSAEDQLAGAVAFVFHGETFKVDVIKVDEIVSGYRRLLIYGAAT